MKTEIDFEPSKVLSTIPPNQLRRVTNALISQPWAIRPAMLDLMLDIVEDHIAGTPRDFTPRRDENKEGLTIFNGVAIVPVDGVLMNRAGILQRISGATSPQLIKANFMQAMRSPDVVAVMLSIFSPGGQVIGTVELGDVIWDQRKTNPRPVVAFVEGLACSGAYWLASQCAEIWATPSSIVGSIGVVSKLVDETRMEKNSGLDSYVLRTGPNKAAGLGVITDDQLQVQREIMEQYFKMFVAAVERGRSIKLNDDELTGREFLAQASVGRLVDAIGTFEDVIFKYQKKT